MIFDKTKIHVRNEQESKKVQEAMFKLGYSWSGDDKRVQLTDANSLFFENGNITYSEGNLEYFNQHSHREISIHEILGTNEEIESPYLKYKKGFNLLMEYFDSIPDEEQEKVSNKLKELGL